METHAPGGQSAGFLVAAWPRAGRARQTELLATSPLLYQLNPLKTGQSPACRSFTPTARLERGSQGPGLPTALPRRQSRATFHHTSSLSTPHLKISQERPGAHKGFCWGLAWWDAARPVLFSPRKYFQGFRHPPPPPPLCSALKIDGRKLEKHYSPAWTDLHDKGRRAKPP